MCSKWEAAAVPSTFLALIYLRIWTWAHWALRAAMLAPRSHAILAPGTPAISRGLTHCSMTWRETRRWQLKATSVFPSGSSDFWRWRICSQITITKNKCRSFHDQCGIFTRYSTINYTAKPCFIQHVSLIVIYLLSIKVTSGVDMIQHHVITFLL